MIETMKRTDRLISASVKDFFAYLGVVRLVLVGSPLLLILHIKCFGQSEKLAITNITAFTEPYTPPIEHATILISNGKFKRIGLTDQVKIPKGYTIIDGSGKYATAGFWNSHVHFMEPKWNDVRSIARDSLAVYLQEMFTAKGFTYVYDLAQLDIKNFNALRDIIRTERLKSPIILSVGVPITSASPFYISPLKLPELKTTKEVRKHIRTQISNGASGIKLWTASPTGDSINYLDTLLIAKAASMTRRKRMPLFAHPSNLRGVEIAVEHGVSVLAHVAADDRKVWDDTLVKKMVAHNVALIPTLKLHFWDLRSVGLSTDNNPLTVTAIRQLETFHKGGGLVIFGTDVGYMDDYDIEEELVQMQNAGMGFDQILAALTSNPAHKFNLSKKTGTISIGKNADLVILNKNPALAIQHLTTVYMTILNGIIIFVQ